MKFSYALIIFMIASTLAKVRQTLHYSKILILRYRNIFSDLLILVRNFNSEQAASEPMNWENLP